jgi:hypothetical protein
MRCKYCLTKAVDIYIEEDDLTWVCQNHLNDCIESSDLAKFLKKNAEGQN